MAITAPFLLKRALPHSLTSPLEVLASCEASGPAAKVKQVIGYCSNLELVSTDVSFCLAAENPAAFLGLPLIISALVLEAIAGGGGFSGSPFSLRLWLDVVYILPHVLVGDISTGRGWASLNSQCSVQDVGVSKLEY